MKKEDVKYGAYVQILKEELVPGLWDVPSRCTGLCGGEGEGSSWEKPDKVRIGASDIIRTLNL